MTLDALTPTGIYGWIGLGLMGAAFLWHKTLSSMGLILALGIGAYLYFVVDANTTPA